MYCRMDVEDEDRLPAQYRQRAGHLGCAHAAEPEARLPDGRPGCRCPACGSICRQCYEEAHPMDAAVPVRAPSYMEVLNRARRALRRAPAPAVLSLRQAEVETLRRKVAGEGPEHPVHATVTWTPAGELATFLGLPVRVRADRTDKEE